MMLLLAKTAAAAANTTAAAPSPLDFEPITRFPVQQDFLTWCHQVSTGSAILIMLAGVVYLMYGWKMFRGLILLNAVLIGAYIGVIVGSRYATYPLAGGLIGAAIAGITTWPLMKWAVAVIGGLVGAVLGASVWMAADLDPAYAWAGALTGLVGFGLFSFILFRASIIMYTSLQGAIMVVMGLLGLAFKYPEMAQKVSTSLTSQPLMLPIAVGVPVLLGLIYQQTHSQGESGPPAPAKKG
ncbi:MAG: hypothetical protein ABSH20_26440 [Tepidisphaeraceae bacterium]|jgi:hypothetical protein